MQLDVSLQAQHAEALRRLLQQPDGVEASAYVLFGRVDRHGMLTP